MAHLEQRAQTMPSTIVIGSGWAGLTCSYRLAKAGHKVTVLEASPNIGGRARSIKFNSNIVDNGQHLLIGAYHSTIQLIKELGLNPDDLLLRTPMRICMRGRSSLDISLPKLPTPYHVLWSLLSTKDLSWHDKRKALSLCYFVQRTKGNLSNDCSVAELLKTYNQTDNLIKSLWEPLALAAMTTPIERASARVFIKVLSQCFSLNSADSNWLLPRTDLTSLLPEHISRYLYTMGSEIVCGTAVKKLEITQNNCIKVLTRATEWRADNIVLAVPPWQAKTLLPLPTLDLFVPEPITTVYLQSSDKVKLPYPMIGLTGTTTQWVFDRRFADQPNILSAIISGSGQHLETNKQHLAQQVAAEINNIFPGKITSYESLIIKEKRAAFSCDVKIQTLRPTAKTPINNVWLCGDYLQTNLPSTLEGAVISGMQTGEEILKYIASL